MKGVITLSQATSISGRGVYIALIFVMPSGRTSERIGDCGRSAGKAYLRSGKYFR